MARFSGATVLLILVATVSVYTCAILGGAALVRTLDRLPTTKQPAADSTLQVSVSVSFRSLAKDFAKELWGGNHRESRSSDAALPSSAERASQPQLMLVRGALREISSSDGVREGAATAATEPWDGYHNHREERLSGGRAHPSPGDRAAAAALPSYAARASLPLSPAELEYHQHQSMLRQRAAIRREISRRDGIHEEAATATATARTEPWGGYQNEGRSRTGAGDGAASLSAVRQRQMIMQAMQQEAVRSRRASTEQQTARPLSRHSNFSGEITEGTLPAGGVVKVGAWGGSGGQAFYMGGGSGRGASPPRLLSVTLYHADAVHSFSFEYLQGTVVRNTAPSGGRRYGSKGRRATINFAPDEHLTAVEGTFGRCRGVVEVVVTSLTFRTDKGRTYGPYGAEAGTSFSIPAANGCIVGFWGRSGWLLDAIGVYIMPCQVYKPALFVSHAYKATS